MEKIGTKKIEVSNGKFEEFDVYPCNCRIGDVIWFDDGIEDSHYYLKGKVTDINPEHWWIYDDGEKVLGCISVECVSEGDYYCGHHFQIDFKDIIYDEPEKETEEVEVNQTDNDLNKRAVACCMTKFPLHETADAESMRQGYIYGAEDEKRLIVDLISKIDISRLSSQELIEIINKA